MKPITVSRESLHTMPPPCAPCAPRHEKRPSWCQKCAPMTRPANFDPPQVTVGWTDGMSGPGLYVVNATRK